MTHWVVRAKPVATDLISYIIKYISGEMWNFMYLDRHSLVYMWRSWAAKWVRCFSRVENETSRNRVMFKCSPDNLDRSMRSYGCWVMTRSSDPNFSSSMLFATTPSFFIFLVQTRSCILFLQVSRWMHLVYTLLRKYSLPIYYELTNKNDINVCFSTSTLHSNRQSVWNLNNEFIKSFSVILWEFI